MTDEEIAHYLDIHHWSIKAQNGIKDILNTSSQIKSTKYNTENKTMTITTPNNSFTFKWILGKYSGGSTL